MLRLDDWLHAGKRYHCCIVMTVIEQERLYSNTNADIRSTVMKRNIVHLSCKESKEYSICRLMLKVTFVY